MKVVKNRRTAIQTLRMYQFYQNVRVCSSLHGLHIDTEHRRSEQECVGHRVFRDGVFLVHLTFVNLLHPNLDPKFQAYEHLKNDHDAMHVLDLELLQVVLFKFYQTINVCVT